MSSCRRSRARRRTARPNAEELRHVQRFRADGQRVEQRVGPHVFGFRGVGGAPRPRIFHRTQMISGVPKLGAQRPTRCILPQTPTAFAAKQTPRIGRFKPVSAFLKRTLFQHVFLLLMTGNALPVCRRHPNRPPGFRITAMLRRPPGLRPTPAEPERVPAKPRHPEPAAGDGLPPLRAPRLPCSSIAPARLRRLSRVKHPLARVHASASPLLKTPQGSRGSRSARDFRSPPPPLSPRIAPRPPSRALLISPPTAPRSETPVHSPSKSPRGSGASKTPEAHSSALPANLSLTAPRSELPVKPRQTSELTFPPSPASPSFFRRPACGAKATS